MSRNADASPGRTRALIPLSRKRLGDAIDIHADSNSSYDPPKAIEVGRMLEDINAVYFEEPCPFDHFEDTRRVTEALIVMLSVPFALVGGLWLMWWLGFNFSVAVVVGFIALAGVAAETGVIMLIYLDGELKERKRQCEREKRSFGPTDLHAAIMTGAVERIRPKMMTVTAIMAGLLPILWSHGAGSEVMQRIAVPMIGGMVSSAALTLVVIPVVYALVKGFSLRRGQSNAEFRQSSPSRAH